MERLGLGPDLLLADNPSLVYGRMTGWGQERAARRGRRARHQLYRAFGHPAHDRPRRRPAGGRRPPVNYVGDFGGGGMMLAFGMVSALLAVRAGGARPGDRLRDDRRLRLARQPDLGALRRGPVGGPAGRQPDRQRRALLRHLRDRRTANGSRSARSSRNSTHCCASSWASPATPISTPRPTPRAGPCSRTGYAPSSAPARASNGALCSRAATPASPRSSRSPKRRSSAQPGARRPSSTVDGVTQPAPAPRYSETATDAPVAPRADAEGLLAELGYDDARIAALRTAGVVG